MHKKISYAAIRIAFILLILLCLSSLISAAVALLLGILFSLIFGNPYLDHTRKVTQRLLQLSVIGLGAGMNLWVIWQESLHGIWYTAIGIFLTVILGLCMGKFLKTEANTSLLVTVGTAICGGSAIAAVAPIINAKAHEISPALVAIFLLNGVALFIFPPIGHYFGLTQTQFGFWSALAIHDTSSVVGAAMHYGSDSVAIATTVKLARALWIIPTALIIGFFWSRKKEYTGGKKKYPWFILGFLLLAALVTFIPSLQSTGVLVSDVAKRTLVLTLFLIGSTFMRSTLKSVGVKPFVQAFVLWVVMASTTLFVILSGWIGGS
jgi:uncharacterized integral membrane protein (TIGR00698 family)